MAKQKMDSQTLELLNRIKSEKEEIEKAERPNWKTNASFAFFEGSQAPGLSVITNIKAVTDVRILIMIASHIKIQHDAYHDVAKIMGVTTPFTWCGFSMEDWFEDIKSRINKVNISSKKAKLEALEARANAIISPELRREMELEAISKELGQ